MYGRNILIVFLLFLVSAPALNAREATPQSPYTPPGLYDVEQVRLDNGFLVILKQRSETRNVSLRLAVKIGGRSFDCTRRETPHLIEHLLFSGTSLHTESELDRRIEDHGGTWNATTGGRYTIYEVNIFDRYADLAVDTLYEIMTDTSITEDKVRTVKEIVQREDGGKPTIVRRLLYRYGIGQTAWKKADAWLLPGTGAICPGLPDLSAITVGQLTSAFKSFYVPGNMVLIVVGDFDRAALLKQLRSTFGSLPSAPVPVASIHTPPFPDNGPVRLTGTFTPFLGSNGYVGAAFRTDGLSSPDLPALRVLTAYLDEKLYDVLRVKNGLSYGPEVSLFLRPDYGILYVSADTGLTQIGRVSKLIHTTLDRMDLTQDHDQIEGIKQKLLLRWAQGYETNAATANFYADHLPELEQLGGFRDYAKGIEHVVPEDVAHIAAMYLRSGNRVDVRSVPTLTYTRLFISLVVLLLGAVWIITVILRRRARARRRMPPSYIRKI